MSSLSTSLSSKGQRYNWFYQLILWVGVLASLFAVAVAVIFPVFIPPLVKLDWYPTTFLISLPLFLAGPLLAIVGFFFAWGLPKSQLVKALKSLFAVAFLLGSLCWIGLDGYRAWKVGWVAFYEGPEGLLAFYSFLFAPGLIALGLSLLISENRLKDHIAFILATMGYQLLIFFLLYLLYLTIAPNHLFLVEGVPPKRVAKIIGSLLAVFCLEVGIVGTLLMRKELRLRFHLLATTPIWVPFFLVAFFWSLLINITIYFIEDIFGVTLQAKWPIKVFVFSWLSLILFPLLLTFDFCVGLIRFLGQGALDHFFPINEKERPESDSTHSSLTMYLVGTFLFFTAPLWMLPTFFYMSMRLFVLDSLILPLLRKNKNETR